MVLTGRLAGTVRMFDTGFSSSLGSVLRRVLVEAVGTVLLEGALVISASSAVTPVHFTGAEGRLMTRSFRLLTVEVSQSTS